MSKNKIGLVSSQIGLSTVPSLVGLVNSLSAHGFGIDTFTCEDNAFQPLEFPARNVRSYLLPDKYRQGQAGWRWQFFASWIPFLLRKCEEEKYICLIGIEPWGLLLVSILSKLVRTPFVYLSLELMFEQDLNSLYLRLLKKLERWSNQYASLTITQDWDRAALLCAENKISKERVEILPNAPPGPANPAKTTVLRDFLNIPGDMLIALHLGGIGPETQNLELAQYARRAQLDVAIVFHSRKIISGDYADAFIEQIDTKHTFFSAGPVPASEVSNLVASADIGIALYKARKAQKNVYTMGLSSGKIAHYLQRGLPVVATGLPTIKKYIEGYGCGICVDDIEQIGDAVKTIRDNYSKYSQNALTCFQQEFELNRNLQPIIQRLDTLVQTT